MRKILLATAVLTGLSSLAHAETIAPANVQFEDGVVTNSLTGMAGDADAGREVMNKGSGNCIACHKISTITEWGFHGEVGPTLDGAGTRWSEAELRGIVSNAKMTFEGSMMPSFYKTTGYIRPGDEYTGKAAQGELPPLLSAQQIEDVVAFLLTLTEE